MSPTLVPGGCWIQSRRSRPRQTDAVRRGPDTCHLHLTVMDKVDFARTVGLGLCQVWTLTLYGLRTEDIRVSVQGLRSTLKLLMSTTAEQMDTLTTNRTDRQDQKTKPLCPLYTESMRMPVPTGLWIWPAHGYWARLRDRAGRSSIR